MEDREKKDALAPIRNFFKISKEKSSLWFIISFSIARITTGTFFGLTGTTLPMLADSMGVSLATANWIYAVRSIAIMLGSFMPELIFGRYPPLTVLALALVANGITISLIPTFKSIIIMNIAVAATGFSFGIVDMGVQSLILKTWGEKGSRSLIQTFHGMFAIGAVAAPYIVQPFISSNQGEKLPLSCTVPENSSFLDFFNEDSDDFQLWIPYMICGVLIIVSGVLFLYLQINNVLSNLGEVHCEISDKREERPISTLIPFFFSVFFQYFASQSVEVVFNAQIYTYARCVNYTISDAVALTSLYWVAFGSSRFLAIFFSKIFSPFSYIGVGLAFGIAGTLLLYTKLLWLSVAIVGFTVAVYYPCGISFASQWTKMSGRYIGIFGLGCTSGAMITPIINSQLMETNFNVFKITVLLMQFIFFIAFIAMLFIGKKLVKPDPAQKDETSDIVSQAQPLNT